MLSLQGVMNSRQGRVKEKKRQQTKRAGKGERTGRGEVLGEQWWHSALR